MQLSSLAVRVATVLGAALLLAALPGGVAAPRTATADEATFDVTYFYGELSPHGTWVRVDPYGWGWMPDVEDFDWRPYHVGHWVWIDGLGWTWLSDEPWAWACYHYGRWIYLDEWGWIWLPGTVWAPAWVEFRIGPGWIGWAPLPPPTGWRVDTVVTQVTVPVLVQSWTFVPIRHFAEPDVAAFSAPPVYGPWLARRTTTTVQPTVANDNVVLTGLEPVTVERVSGRRVPRLKARSVENPKAAAAVRVEDGSEAPIFRPRLRPQGAETAPQVRVRTRGEASAWLERRRGAMQRYLESQRRALDEEPDAPRGRPQNAPPSVPANEPPRPPPRGQPQGPQPQPPTKPPQEPGDDVGKRREEAQKATEQEQRRIQDLLERQRKRMEQEEKKGKDDKSKGKGKGNE